MSETVDVFVYGTLMEGMGNHCVLGDDAVFVGKAETVSDSYTMVSMGGFPGVSFNPDGHTKVKGEVWTIPVTQRDGPVDRLEGYPRFYDRDQVMVSTEDGITHLPWMYNIPLNSIGRSEVIEDGDWRAYVIKCWG